MNAAKLSEALHEMLNTGESIDCEKYPQIRIVRRDAATQHIRRLVKVLTEESREGKSNG